MSLEDKEEVKERLKRYMKKKPNLQVHNNLYLMKILMFRALLHI